MRTLSPRSALWIAGFVMGTMGILTAGLGPVLPNLATNTASSLAEIGSLFSALFLGGLLTQLFGGPLNDRVGQRPVLASGLVMMALGCLGIAFSPNLPIMLGSAVIAGMGRGAMSISSHLLVARVFADRSAIAFNWLNVFYGVGAIAGPGIAGLAIYLWDSAIAVLWLGAALLLILAPLVWQTVRNLPGVVRRGQAATPQVHPLRQPLLWVSGLILLLYVGCETGFSGWVSTYFEQTIVLDTATAALATSGFWFAITLGRVLGALLGQWLGAPRLVLICMVGGVMGTLGVVLSTGNFALSLLATIFLGIFFGPIYPTALAMVTTGARRAPGTATSIASAMGGLGGTLLPWLQGNLMEYAGPQSSMLLILGAAGLMIIFELLRRALVSREPEETPQAA